MSRGDLQEMEVGTKQSKTAVNAKAGAADAMDTSKAGSYEDLGGPTPDNYKPDDDSAKLATPGGSLKQVKDVVNKGAKAAEAAKGVKEEEELDTEAVVEEDQEVTDEVVNEEETGENEVVAEEETTEEETVEEEVVAEYDIEEDVNALLQGEELSEEFQEKARTIFETAITAKVAEVKESLEARYSEVLSEEVEDIKKELNERVDSYLEYVAEEWYIENQLAVEAGLKSEMTESFLTGMKSLFEEHYVTIPEEKYNVLESMVEKLDDMETKLNEQIEKNVSLNRRLAESVADGILDQVSEGLAQTQKEKLGSLAESVEFESENQYREKLETLKGSYFPLKAVSPSAKKENLSEGVDSSPEAVNGSMAAYLKTLSSFSK
jgi:hypothetical protein